MPRDDQDHQGMSAPDAVDLRVPADPAYLAVIRTATAGLGASLDLTIDEIDDLRIAVDEACAIVLLGHAHPGRSLDASFVLGDARIDVLITGPAASLPDDADFSWSVLRALATSVLTGIRDTGTWISLTHERRVAP